MSLENAFESFNRTVLVFTRGVMKVQVSDADRNRLVGM